MELHNFCSKIPGSTETGGVGDDCCAYIHWLPLVLQAETSFFCITLGGREEINWLIPFLITGFFCFPFSCFHVCKFLLLLEIFANSVSGGAFVLAHYFPLLLLLCSFPFILLYCFYSLSTLQSHLAHPLLSFL